MSVHKLILLPKDAGTAPVNCGELALSLQEDGFIGDPATSAHGDFYPTGDRFLQLVSFLGCSPAIELDPPVDPAARDAAVLAGSFCHVVLQCSDALLFRADPGTRPPRCPHCGQAVTDWADALQRWQADPASTQWSCAECEQAGDLTGWVFRKTAGFGKVFVEIRGIYPSEAVPGEALMNRLAAVTGGPWQYMYIKE